MKRLFFFTMITLLCLFGCEHSSTNSQSGNININEAKACFEETVLKGIMNKSPIVPPSFTPVWDKSSFNEGLNYLEVPIEKNTRCEIPVLTYRGGNSATEIIIATQHMAVSYNLSGELECFMVTCIPVSDSGSSLSGILLANSLMTGKITFSAKFESGKPVKVYDRRTHEMTDGESYNMSLLVSNIVLSSLTHTTVTKTRADGEDQDPGDGICPYCLGSGCEICSGYPPGNDEDVTILPPKACPYCGVFCDSPNNINYYCSNCRSSF